MGWILTEIHGSIQLYKNEYKNKRQQLALDALVKYVKKICGQKCIDYLGSTTFKSLDYDIKQKLL